MKICLGMPTINGKTARKSQICAILSLDKYIITPSFYACKQSDQLVLKVTFYCWINREVNFKAVVLL